MNKIIYYVGIDGGGSGTRLVITDSIGSSSPLSIIDHGPPSALALGRKTAWENILATLKIAFQNIGHDAIPYQETAIALGLSGANHLAWHQEFLSLNPGFPKIILDTDGFTTLLGAFEGTPGVIVALGTGSVGVILRKDGMRDSVSGWGYPAGDEASGSWLGKLAVSHTQKVCDGRRKQSKLSELILQHIQKHSSNGTLISWVGDANQTQYATLAPFVFQAKDDDPVAHQLLVLAGKEIEEMHGALDPNFEYPFSLCGKLGPLLRSYLSTKFNNVYQACKKESQFGALYLLR